MRTSMDNGIRMYSTRELEAMKRVKETPASKYNYCPFTLEEIIGELKTREGRS